jgi:YbbR domain-containing protein
MRKRFVNRKLAVAVIAALFAAVGLVYAAWTTNGTGSAYAKAGTAQTIGTIDVSASSAATLYPGVSGDVLIKLDNPNPYAVTVTAVSGSGSITADGGHAGCTTTGVTFTNQTGLSLVVPAKVGAVNGTLQTTLTGAASMSNASLNACQGATFTIPVSLTGTS